MLKTKEEWEAALAACDTHKGSMWVDIKGNLWPLGAGLAVRHPKFKEQFSPECYLISPLSFKELTGKTPYYNTIDFAKTLGYEGEESQYLSALESNREEVKKRIQKKLEEFTNG